MIVGEGAVSHGAAWNKQIGRDVIALASKIATMGGEIAEGWNGYALLHNAASRVGGIDIGFVPHDGGVCSADQVKLAGKGELDVLFLLGADEYDTPAMGKAFVVYVGTHGDAGAHRADVILPAATYTEKSGTYVNTEGRVQIAERAVFPPGEAKEDWAIFRALSAVLGSRCRSTRCATCAAAMYAEFPHLAQIDQIVAGRRRRGARTRGPRDQDRERQAHLADRRFLPDQPHRAGVGHHGRVLADAGRSEAGGGVTDGFRRRSAQLPARHPGLRLGRPGRLRLQGAAASSSRC